MKRQKKFLTVKNSRKLYTFLKSYIKDVLKDEETINSFSEAFKEAERVEVYGNIKYLTPSLVSDWLKGLPISTEYSTYNICCMMLECITGSSNYNQLDEYKEDPVDLDEFYWEVLGFIVYREGIKEF